MLFNWKSKILSSIVAVAILFTMCPSTTFAEKTQLHEMLENKNHIPSVDKLKLIVDAHPEWLSERDDIGRTPLDIARENDLSNAVALLVQFTYGMEGRPEFPNRTDTQTMALVSSRFLAESEARFHAHLESVLKGVTYGSITPEAAVISVGTNHQEFLDLLRSSLNQGMEKEELASREALIQRITGEKEHEIQVLQERLDTLRHSSGCPHESFRIFDQAMEHLEKVIKAIIEEFRHENVPELVTTGQIDRKSRSFRERLDDIREDVQKGFRTLEEASEKTQEIYGRNVKELIGELKERYDDILESITGRYNERQQRLEEAYEQQKDLMQRMINEITAANLRLEKEAELKDLISKVYISNPDNEFIKSRSFILGSGEEIRNIGDLFERRHKVEDIYNKVRLFSHLFGREDLGVEVQASNLEAVRLWLDSTTRDSILRRYGVATNLSGNKIRGYYNEEGRDCPGYREHAVEGKGFSGTLNETIEQLRQSIGANSAPALSRLQHILEATNAVNNSVRVVWNHPSFYGHNTNQLLYWLNGHQLGRFFHEYGGGFWKDIEGFLGNFHGRCWVPCESGDARDVWNSQFVTRFNAEVDNIQKSIISRAVLLFDFETNPDSPLQMLYRESGQINPSIINFPAAEIDALVKQCNEFVKKIN